MTTMLDASQFAGSPIMRDVDRADARIAPCVTLEGRALLEARITDLRDRRLAELAPLLAEVDRDERVVADYEAVLLEIAEWEAFLAEANVLEPRKKTSRAGIHVGDRIEIAFPNGDREWVHLVHPKEAFLDDERISATSPLGAALLGAHKGDVVRVDAPSGSWDAQVVQIASGPLLKVAS